jgi:hypothetical protein
MSLHDPKTRRRTGKLAALCLPVLAASLVAQVAPRQNSASILEYINQTWAVLTRSNHDLASAAPDPKFPSMRRPWPVYVSIRPLIVSGIKKRSLSRLFPVKIGDAFAVPRPVATSYAFRSIDCSGRPSHPCVWTAEQWRFGPSSFGCHDPWL